MAGGSKNQYTHTLTLFDGKVQYYRMLSDGRFCVWSRMFTNDDWGWWESAGTQERCLTKRSNLIQCCRCSEIKEDFWFPSEMKYWNQQCNRCIRSPSGAMPLPQEEHDRNEHQTKPNASNAI